MPLYEMKVVSQTLWVRADNEEQAEEKYDAFWGGDCPCGAGDSCDCVECSDEVSHTTEEIGE